MSLWKHLVAAVASIALLSVVLCSPVSAQNKPQAYSVSAALNSAYAMLVGTSPTIGFSVTGLTSSGATLTIKASNDGINFVTIPNAAGASSITADGQFVVSTGGYYELELLVTSGGSGNIIVSSFLSPNSLAGSTGGGGGGGGGAITPTSVSGGNAAVTVGVTSTIVLTAATRQALALQNTDTVSTIWCRADGGTAAVGTAGYKIPPGSLFSWGPVVMPSGQVNCISDTGPAVAWTEQH
jgi:hypothetical protein